MIDYLGLGALIVLVVLFGFLAMRAWRARNPAVKWGGGILASLLTLVGLIVLVIALIGTYKLNVSGSHPVPNLQAATAPDRLAQGEKIARLCAGCHSTAGDLPLDGSKGDVLAEPGTPPLGSLYFPNLTPAGETKDWTDGEIIRAIREGVHKSGRPLIIMPSVAFKNMADADVQALVGYLRSMPAVQNNTPPPRLNVLAALFIGAGMFNTSEQPAITQPIVAPPAGTSAEYGKYLVSTLGCHDCHGENLDGVVPPGPAAPTVQASNLRVVVPKWTEADFIKFFRTGIDPTGHNVGDNMPWKDYGKFTDDDFRAIFNYLHGLAPK